MIKQILAALAGLALCAPIQARVEDGTKPLLEIMDSSGILVAYNTSDCRDGNYLGVYRHRGMQRAMILCPGATVDAEDHMVVRHEVIHAIQHCVNVMRQTPMNSPVIDDHETFVRFVKSHLSQEAIDWIYETYPRAHWNVELEAFAGANAYTSAELEELFLKACVRI